MAPTRATQCSILRGLGALATALLARRIRRAWRTRRARRLQRRATRTAASVSG